MTPSSFEELLEKTESYSDAGYPFAEEYFAARKVLFNIKVCARKITRNLDHFKIFTFVFHTEIFLHKYNTFCRTGFKSSIGFRNIESKYLEQISNGSFRQYGIIRRRICGGQWGRSSYTFWVASIKKPGMSLCLRRNVWGSMMYITPVLRS
jgi:hypothetical protein